MNGFLGVILREGLDLAAVACGTFTGEETERAMAGGFVLTVTHFGGV
jgi:hypothetical protein